MKKTSYSLGGSVLQTTYLTKDYYLESFSEMTSKKNNNKNPIRKWSVMETVPVCSVAAGEELSHVKEKCFLK